MYGLLFNILRETVIKEYGEHYWTDICQRSGMMEMKVEVLAKELYGEDKMTSLLENTATVLGVDVGALLELMGIQFFHHIRQSGHYKVVSCLGNTLEGFILNLDALHDHLALAYPKMKPLSFRAEKTQTGLLLHYFSTRRGLYPMVMGMVTVIAKEFYSLNVDMKLVGEKIDEESSLPYHYQFSIEIMEGRRDGRALRRLRGNSIVPDLASLPPSRTSASELPSRSSIESDSSTIHSPLFLRPRGREERSQSTGQILPERSRTHNVTALTPSTIAELARLCPYHLPDVAEEEEEEEEEDRTGGEDSSDPNRTPSIDRRGSLYSPSPQASPLHHRRQINHVENEEEYSITLRRGSSHSSLSDGLPPSLLPALSSSRLPFTNHHHDSSVSLIQIDASWPITKNLFQVCFPFHIIFDTTLTIRHMGVSMARLFPEAISREDKITDHFNLLRPIGTFNYETIRCSIHNPFILVTKPSPSQEADHTWKSLQFRGQMMPVVNLDSCPILFIGSPRVETVEDLQLQGLYLTDLPVHDVTRELILMSHHFKAEVNLAFQLEVTKRELEMEKLKVQEEQRRADQLLHAMLPPSVTKQLTSGGDTDQVVAQEVEMVTILFSDIRDFTTICHRCNPMDVVRMLNQLYTSFDSYLERHKVYKVETIGDAYMIAAGLLDTSHQHAEAVTNMAFDMRQAANFVSTPHTKESIQIRIGVHTGHVVAGVVGTKMPRYCLFGDTVNTASRMESHGEPGRIHISQSTYKKLRGLPYIFWNRGKIRVKGLPELQQTYFVEPGEEHELSEKVTIRVAIEKEQESDSEWEEDYNTFVRQRRLPSFVRYKNMHVVTPTPIHSADTSLTSIQIDNNNSTGSLTRLHQQHNRRRRKSSLPQPSKRPASPLTYQPTMKERLTEKLSTSSVGSYSIPNGLSSFMEYEEGTYRELGIDLHDAQLTVETASDVGRKLSNSSVGVLITVEPEGKSVTFTRERISVSSSAPSNSAQGEEDGIIVLPAITIEEDGEASIVKSKKHKKHTNSKLKNRCKIS